MPRRKKGERFAKDAVIGRRFKIRKETIRQINAHAREYGSLGRAIQFATEVLYRLRSTRGFDPFKVDEEDEGRNVGRSYKLVPRTSRLIDELAARHNVTLGQVLAACARFLDTELEISLHEKIGGDVSSK